MDHAPSTHDSTSAVLHTGGLNWATEKNVVEQVLRQQPGVLVVEANPVAQTATVIFDPHTTSIADLQGWIRDCGLHCAGKGDHQRLQAPFSEFAVVIDGRLFSAWMPKHLWQELPWPPYGASEAEVLAYEQAYNERGRWRFQLHAGPDADGATRWKCPFHAGFLRSRQLPFTMRRSRNVPLVELPAGAKCCDGIISVSAADLPFRQKLTPLGSSRPRDFSCERARKRRSLYSAFTSLISAPHWATSIKICFRRSMSARLHFHGLTVPNEMDGVPFVTQPAIMPGQYWTYRFTIEDPPGMYVYHSHFNSTEQVGKGLYGALIVGSKTGAWTYPMFTWDPNGYLKTGAPAKIDDEYTMFLGDGPLGYVLNAKSFPATAPLTAKLGDWVLIHMANDGSLLHPMHLHGFHFEVVAQDGFPLDQPYLADTLVVAPGQRFDVLVHADQTGAWAFHCHILPHVEGPQGMYGMVTALVVQ